MNLQVALKARRATIRPLFRITVLSLPVSAALLLITLTILFGCSKRPAPPAPEYIVQEKSAAISVAQQLENEVLAPPPEAPGAANAEATEEIAAPEAPRSALDLESLNTILENYVAAHDRVPKTIDEMVRLKLIPRTPVPSPGKRYIIDTVRRQIREEKL